MAKKKLIGTKMKITMASLLIGSIVCFSTAGFLLYKSGFNLNNYTSYSLRNDVYKFGNYFFDIDGDDTDLLKIYTTTQEITNINSLNIESQNIYFNVEEYSGNNIELSVYSKNKYANLNDKKPFVVTNETNNLSIKSDSNVLDNNNSKEYVFVIKIPKSYNKDLKIKCPTGSIEFDSMTLNSLDIEGNNSNVSLKNLSSNKINITISNGTLYTKHMNSKDLSLQASNSSIDSLDLSGNANISANNTSINGDVLKGLTNLNISSNSGNVNLDFPEEFDCLITPSVINGSYSNSLSKEHHDNNTDSSVPVPIKLGSGANKITINVVNGSLSISD